MLIINHDVFVNPLATHDEGETSSSLHWGPTFWNDFSDVEAVGTRGDWSCGASAVNLLGILTWSEWSQEYCSLPGLQGFDNDDEFRAPTSWKWSVAICQHHVSRGLSCAVCRATCNFVRNLAAENPVALERSLPDQRFRGCEVIAFHQTWHHFQQEMALKFGSCFNYRWWSGFIPCYKHQWKMGRAVPTPRCKQCGSRQEARLKQGMWQFGMARWDCVFLQSHTPQLNLT